MASRDVNIAYFAGGGPISGDLRAVPDNIIEYGRFYMCTYTNNGALSTLSANTPAEIYRDMIPVINHEYVYVGQIDDLHIFQYKLSRDERDRLINNKPPSWKIIWRT